MTAVRPAVLDPGLPELAAGTHPEHVRLLFGALLQGGRAVALAAERMHTEYRPGTDCRMSYRLRLAAACVEPWSGFGQVLVRPSGLDLRLFDADPELPALRAATDPMRMGEVLNGWTGAAAGDWRITPVRYRAGERCVLRYRRVDGSAELFGKLYRQDAERHAAAQADLRATLAAERLAGTPRPEVPAVVGHDRRLGMVLHAPAAGRPLRAFTADPSVAGPTRLSALYTAGARVAGLHLSAGTAAPVRSLADDLTELRGYLAVLCQADPALAGRYARLVDLAGRLTTGAVDLAPAHGALRTDQVLVAPDGIALLDLDGLAWAEPARDVGNLLGYLYWRAVRRPAERADLDAAAEAFLDGYRAHSHALDGTRLRGYRAVTLLRIAGRRFRSLQYDEWPLVPQLLEAAAALLPARRVPATAPRPAPLAGLDGATRPSRMTAELAGLLGAAGADPVPVLAADLLSYRAGRAAVVRYRLAAPRGGDRVLLGKLYPDRTLARRAHDIHVRLRAALSGGAGPVVPEPLGVVPDLGLLVLRPVAGRPVGPIPTDAELRAAAGWLARLHASTAVLDRRLDAGEEQRNVAAWARTVREALPDVAGRAQELAAALSSALGVLPAGRLVPIHKDFHHQHVVIGDLTAAIDLDEARMGDPALDVAHFGCYLDLLATRLPTGDLRAAFLRGYTELRDWAPDTAYRVFSAWTCLKIAKQLAVGRGPHPRPTGAAALEQAQRMLAGGLSWLS